MPLPGIPVRRLQNSNKFAKTICKSTTNTCKYWYDWHFGRRGGVAARVGGCVEVRGGATFHLWRMPPISDWQQLPGWEVFINLLPFLFIFYFFLSWSRHRKLFNLFFAPFLFYFFRCQVSVEGRVLILVFKTLFFTLKLLNLWYFLNIYYLLICFYIYYIFLSCYNFWSSGSFMVQILNKPYCYKLFRGKVHNKLGISLCYVISLY